MTSDMSTGSTTPPTDSGQGVAPPAAGKRWSGRKIAVAVGAAVLIVAGGGTAIAIGVNHTASSNQGLTRHGRHPGGPPPAMGRGTGSLRDALHGDWVVPDGNGGYRTERLQTGDVTAVSATSISLTSKDGYKQVYTVDSSTRNNGEPKTGDTVTVVAKVSGDTATAITVREPGQFQRPNGRVHRHR